MRLSREQTDALLHLHATSLQISNLTEVDQHPFTYQLEYRGQIYTACVLSRSWDYWEHRLGVHAPHLSMLIVSKHDSCLPIPVLEIGSEGYFYKEKERPKFFDPRARRTKKTALVFLGALLSGDQQAFDALKRMHISSRKRCKRRLEGLLEERPGRPLLVVKT